MKRFLPALLLMSIAAHAEWTPPEKPNPSAILNEAREDARERRFEDALAKQVWFHENALRIEPAQYGVRLSFALSAWSELAKQYPPAMAAFLQARDAAERDVRSPDATKASFHDASSMNQTLADVGRTASLFKWLDENDPARAKTSYSVAQPALVETKEYALCGKYLQPEEDYANFVRNYRRNLKMAQEERFANMKSFAENKFTADVGTLIALLVLNERQEEAKAIRTKAATEWEAKPFQDTLDEALKGVPPTPFPRGR
jgi:hypothetical protein